MLIVDLFDRADSAPAPPDTFSPKRDAPALRALAEAGVYLGTSSWKYPGWLGLLYDRANYTVRGRFSKRLFERNCLAEYARVFPAVCADGAFYSFPSPAFVSGLAEQTPEDFRFGFKTTDVITMRAFPPLPRYGSRAGRENPDFLNADLFEARFLEPLRALGPRLGVVILEFTRFAPGAFRGAGEFAEALGAFLAALRDPPQIAVEIRNAELLGPELLGVLRQCGAGYVFNQWSHMPPVDEQIARVGGPPGGFLAARFLLADGRVYKEAVESFAPYDRTRMAHGPSRAAARRLIHMARELPRPSYLFVNNRLEGNALNTIAAVLNGST